MARRIVLSDASPLIALAYTDSLPWLSRLLGQVTLTDVVRREIITGQDRPGESTIKEAVAQGNLQVIEDLWQQPRFPDLDEGEASTLRAAVNLNQPCLVLMDEKAGRAVARELGFRVTGTAGLLVAAKQHGLIPAVRPVLEALLAEGFRLSPSLMKAVLTEAKEDIGARL